MKRLKARYKCVKKVDIVDDDGRKTGHTSVPDGEIDVEFELVVDEEKALAWMGHKAAFSSRGVSALGGGAVKLKVVKKTKVPG